MNLLPFPNPGSTPDVVVVVLFSFPFDASMALKRRLASDVYECCSGNSPGSSSA